MEDEKKKPKLPMLRLCDDGLHAMRIFIGSITHTATRYDLFNAFRRFGTISGISTVFKPRHAPAFAFVEFIRASSARQAVESSQSNCRDGPLRVAGGPVIVRPYKPHAKAPHVEKNKLFWARAAKQTVASVPVNDSHARNTSDPIEYSHTKSYDYRALDEFEEDDQDEEILEFDEADEVETDDDEDVEGSEAREGREEGEVEEEEQEKRIDMEKEEENMNIDIEQEFVPQVIDEVLSDGEISRSSTDSRVDNGERECLFGREVPQSMEAASLLSCHRERSQSPASSHASTEELVEPSVSTKAIQTDKPILDPIKCMWRPPSMTLLPPECVLLFREDDGTSWANTIHAELLSCGIRVEECLVLSTDNTTISAALSHIGPTWEPLFALILQEHNCTESSVTLVHFGQSHHPHHRGLIAIQYDLELNAAVSEISSTLSVFRGSSVDRRRIIRHATYTMASGVGLRRGDAERLCEEMLAKRGERIYRTFIQTSPGERSGTRDGHEYARESVTAHSDLDA